jgi:hypothetical protein
MRTAENVWQREQKQARFSAGFSKIQGGSQMANKPAAQKRTDADMEFAKEMEKIANDKAESKYLDQILGLKQGLKDTEFKAQAATMIKVKGADESLSRLLKVMALRRTKEAMKQDGNWTAFCDENGIDIKKADYEISKLGEIKDKALLSFGSAFGYEINKIKYIAGVDSEKLGVEVRGETIIYDGEEIPLAEAPALIEDLRDKFKKEKEERAAETKTYERRMADEKKHISKLEREIKKYERHAHDKGLTAEEDSFLQGMENLRTTFSGFYLQIDPGRIPLDRNNDSVAMKSAYISTLQYIKMQANAAYDTAVEIFGNPSMLPEEGWQFPTAKDGQ